METSTVVVLVFISATALAVYTYLKNNKKQEWNYEIR